MKTMMFIAIASLLPLVSGVAGQSTEAQAANDTPDSGPIHMSNMAGGQLVRPTELDQEASGTGRRGTHQIARLRNEIIALNASLITHMSQAESSIGSDVELLHASILAAQLETVDTAAAYREAKSLIADLDTLRQHAIADLTLPSDYTAPDVPPTALAGASTMYPETVLASTYQDLDINVSDLSVIIGAAILDEQKKLEALAGKAVKGETISLAEMFELQMLMNHLSQSSEMGSSIISAANSAIYSMARGVKG
jgi:hypothetical protein